MIPHRPWFYPFANTMGPPKPLELPAVSTEPSLTRNAFRYLEGCEEVWRDGPSKRLQNAAGWLKWQLLRMGQ